jgi:streptomycin 6-kinase
VRRSAWFVGLICVARFNTKHRALLPRVVENYRSAHEIALRVGKDAATTRALASPTTCRFRPAHSVLPVNRLQSAASAINTGQACAGRPPFDIQRDSGLGIAFGRMSR